MKGTNKRALLLTGLFLAVFAAGYANYAITAVKKTGDTAGSQPGNAFSVFKEERETTRQQELRYIESVVESAETDDATKASAQAQKLSLTANMENELVSEGLIQTGLGMGPSMSWSTSRSFPKQRSRRSPTSSKSRRRPRRRA